MPPDDARAEEAAAWLKKASKDLWRAQITLTLDPPDTEDCMFHCQQAAEKALKAVLVWRDQAFRKTHDLEELAEACRRLESGLVDVTRGLAPLTRFAWEYRYPGEGPPPTLEDARLWTERVEHLMTAVKSVLPD